MHVLPALPEPLFRRLRSGAGGRPNAGKPAAEVKSLPLPDTFAMTDLEHVIDTAWETRATLSPQNAPAAVRDAVAQVIAGLDAGRLRVAEKIDGAWTTHQWIKKAVLLSFRLADTGADALRAARRQRRAVRASTTRCRPSSPDSPTTSSRPPASGSCRRPSRAAARTSRRTSC